MQTAPLLGPSPPPVFLLTTLREGTHDLHERLERCLDVTARFAAPDAYCALLQRFYGFYTPLEARLAAPEWADAWSALGLSPRDRRKANLLEADLRTLGLTDADLADLERCPPALLPSPASAAELVGCAYVLEGATLGGQILGRLLEQALGLTPGAPGAQFFYGYGVRTGVMWQQFRRAAESLAAATEASSPGQGAHMAAQAVAAARRTFAGMDAWLIPEEKMSL